MEERTVLLELEVPEGRNVIAHFQKIVVDNGAIEGRSKPHTVNFPPEDIDFNAVLTSINANITTRKDESFPWPPIPENEWQRAVAVCKAVHTPDVKAQYAAWKAANPPI